MTKGTPSYGKRHTGTHMNCRRCGRHSYHMTKKKCASCGFGASARIRRYAWAHKRIQRPGL